MRSGVLVVGCLFMAVSQLSYNSEAAFAFGLGMALPAMAENYAFLLRKALSAKRVTRQ